MNRIVVPLSGFRLGAGLPDGLDRLHPRSTYMLNEGPRNRHVERSISWQRRYVLEMPSRRD
jgi:hypothetical protein